MRSWLNWIEQRTSNPQVEGSSPPGRACRGFDGFRRTPFFFVLTPISQSVKDISTSINAIKYALTTSKFYIKNGRFSPIPQASLLSITNEIFLNYSGFISFSPPV